MAVKKPKLNKAGIRLLADDLVANKKRYDQDDLGRVDDCGTFCCLAGFCHVRAIGISKFNRLLKLDEFSGFDCYLSGITQLGLTDSPVPQILQSISCWPSDLHQEYISNGPKWRVIAALKALQRLRLDGSIDPDPKAVHTRLPQLKALLAKEK